MELKQPITIDMKAFLLEGKFDCIQMGQTKEWIKHNFPDPDSDNYMGHHLSIWLYGGIEFHFDHEQLYMIWCDNLRFMDRCKTLRVNKWLFHNLDELTLGLAQNQLNHEYCSYRVMFDRELKTTGLQIQKSRVSLWFEQEECSSEYIISAFQLCDRCYDTYDMKYQAI